jgi:hypothetical protein
MTFEARLHKALKPKHRKVRHVSVLRPGVERSEAYKAFVRSLMCRVCRIEYKCGQLSPWSMKPVEAAHTGSHAIGQKASDYTCIPLCRKHHHELDHQIGKAFWRKYNLDRDRIIAALRKRYAMERSHA